MSGESWLLIFIVAPVVVALAIPLTKWSLAVLAKAIVKEINGQLGLQAIRDDVYEIKQQAHRNQLRIEKLLEESA